MQNVKDNIDTVFDLFIYLVMGYTTANLLIRGNWAVPGRNEKPSSG